MELQVINGKSKSVAVSEAVFGCEFKEGLVHQVVTSYMAGSRAGTKAQKTRSEVSGGGIKPWRQKGTGRARAGTIRSPLWRTGGITFAAKPRDYKQKVNKKMYKVAMRSILSQLAREERLIIIEGFDFEKPSTKAMVSKLKEMNVDKALIVLAEDNANVMLSARNIPDVYMANADEVNPYSLIAAKNVVVTTEALKKIEERLS